MEANKILLEKLYSKIIIEFSNQTGICLKNSLDYFYKSQTYELISNGVGDMHCRGEKYLCDELMLEYNFINHKSYQKYISMKQ